MSFWFSGVFCVFPHHMCDLIESLIKCISWYLLRCCWQHVYWEIKLRLLFAEVTSLDSWGNMKQPLWKGVAPCIPSSTEVPGSHGGMAWVESAEKSDCRRKSSTQRTSVSAPLYSLCSVDSAHTVNPSMRTRSLCGGESRAYHYRLF